MNPFKPEGIASLDYRTDKDVVGVDFAPDSMDQPSKMLASLNDWRASIKRQTGRDPFAGIVFSLDLGPVDESNYVDIPSAY